jgi:VanZ family protein
MALILSLSSQSDLPARTNPQTGETIRSTFAAAKLAHVVEYSVLGLLLFRALMLRAGGVRVTLWLAAALAIVGAGLFGCVDEVRQSFVPRREPSLADVALDTASAAAAALAAAGWLRWRSAQKSNGQTSLPDPLSAPEGGDGPPPNPPPRRDVGEADVRAAQRVGEADVRAAQRRAGEGVRGWG